jgi:hypothetical protein
MYRVWMLAVVCSVALAGSTAGSPSAGEAAAAPACHSRVSHAVLPVWARAGFQPPKARIPHMLGRSGRIVAIVFGYPLRSPAGPRRNNKILWVSRTTPLAPAALWIRAQQMEGDGPVGTPVERVVQGGPGPSYVNLPQAGCWRLSLAWSGRTDTLDLAYGTGG